MKLSKLVLLCAVVLTTVACGKIPSAYQGTFVDQEHGVKITLGSSDGTIETSADGRKFEAKAEEYSFDVLVEGKAALYVGVNPANQNMSDVYWINPNMATKQSVEGFTWYQTEVIYTILDTKREDKVPSIQFFHCRDGMMMLDMATKRVQLGCPAGPKNYNVVRTDK
jgi:hypothetical protein